MGEFFSPYKTEKAMNTTKKEELTKVQRLVDGKCNLIDANGNEQLFDRLDNFKDGFAVVERTNGEFCKINKTGKIVGLSK